MGEGLMSSYLRSKLSSILQDAEATSGGSSAGIILRIKSLNNNTKYRGRIPVDDLRELTESVSEWHVFLHTAAVSKKRWFDLRRLLHRPLSKWMIKRRMQTRLDSINEMLTARTPTPPPHSPTSPPAALPPAREVRIELTRPIDDLSHMIGFDAEAERIEDWLLPAEAAWRVVGIVGRCGCGKTTLAQKVFASPRIAEEFSPRIWVCLSGNEDSRERVVSLILKEMGHEHDVSDEQLRERLEGRRYLIVLDDAWPLDDDKLLKLPRESGGAVIVTSRLGKTIIEKMAKDVILVEPQLSHDNCLQIFSQALQQQQEKVRLEDIKLDLIGDDLKRNIDRLPLAAKTLGTILPGLLLKSYWIRARDTTITWENDRRYWRWTSLPPPQHEEEVAELLNVCWLDIRVTVSMKKFLLKTRYSAYLVFKLTEERRWSLIKKGTGRLKILRDDKLESDQTCTVFLRRKEEEEDEDEEDEEEEEDEDEEEEEEDEDEDEEEEEKVVHYPEFRGGEEGTQGWMEIKLGEFETSSKDEGRSVQFAFENITSDWKSGLVIKGIEIRPSYHYPKPPYL